MVNTEISSVNVVPHHTSFMDPPINMANELQSVLYSIDQNIIELLNQRMECSLQVGRIKAANEHKSKQQQSSIDSTALPNSTPAEQANALVYIPSREKQLFDKIILYNQQLNGLMSSNLLCAIWREIMSASIALQRTTHVAIPDALGTFIHTACKQRFGASIDVLSCQNIDDVFHCVRTGKAQYGILPFQRQSVGNDPLTMSLLSQPNNKLCIYAEIYLSHQYYLMVSDQASGSNSLHHNVHQQIKRVYGTVDSIQQCTTWLTHQLPGIQICIEHTLSQCVAKCHANRSYAVIGSELCASVHNLSILCSVSDDTSVPAYDTVRYVVISNKIDVYTGEDKTFVLFELYERSGALHDALNIVKQNNVNMTRLESKANSIRPTKWDYVFAELEGYVYNHSIVYYDNGCDVT